MREVKFDGKKFAVRGLTRGELKKLREDGRDLLRLKDMENEQVGETIDAVIPMCTDPPADPDELTPKQAGRILTALYAETWGSPDEEKNLSSSGPGSQTRSGSNTADTAE